MKIIAINGSPKGKSSNTDILVKEFCKGAEEAGAAVEHVYLIEKEIKNCHGCFNCWTKTPGKCIINDDMKEIRKKLLNKDIIIFATPLYVDNVTGIMKTFIDRGIAGGNPYFERDENGEIRHQTNRDKHPKYVVISNCGFPEQSHFEPISFLFKRMARNAHTEVIAEIYRGEGPLLTVRSPDLQPILEKYKRYLRKAGKEVVQNNCISNDTQNELYRPLLPFDLYLEQATKNWDRCLQNE